MESDDNSAVSVGEFLLYALRQWVVSLILISVAMIGATAYVELSPPEYTATAKIIVLGDESRITVGPELAVGNYAELILSDRVLRYVEDSDPDRDVDHIREHMKATRDKSSEIVTIEYSSNAVGRAASVVNATIESFQYAVADLYDVPEDGVNVLSAPSDSNIPKNKSFIIPIIAGFIGGVALALCVSFLRFDLSRNKKKPTAGGDYLRLNMGSDPEKLHGLALEAEKAELEARKLMAEERAARARQSISTIGLKEIRSQISIEKKKLKIATIKKEEAEAEVARRKANAESFSLELKAILERINLAEGKKIARRQSRINLKNAKETMRINREAELVLAQINAQKRIAAAKAAGKKEG